MDAASLTEFAALLADRRAEIESTVSADGDRLAAIRAARSDTPADDEHDPEGSTMSAEWSRAEGLRESSRRELDEIAEAEGRMASGTYGVCLACSALIPPERLRIRPAAPLCVGCASL